MANGRPNRRYFFLRTAELKDGRVINKYCTRPRVAGDRDPAQRYVNDEVARRETLELLRKEGKL